MTAPLSPDPRPLCAPHRGPARLGAWFLSHILPALCAGCGEQLGVDQRQGICISCWSELERTLRFLPRSACSRCAEPLSGSGSKDLHGAPCCSRCLRAPPPHDWALALWVYSGAARGAVLAFKYGEIPGLAEPLAEAALRAAAERFAPGQILIPVPLHPRRRRERGLNAAEELARAITRRSGIPMAQALERPLSLTPQSGLGRTERRRNAANSFRISRPEAVHGRPVVLVDDVLTTGSTAGVCARLLLGAGARSVGVLALARARLE